VLAQHLALHRIDRDDQNAGSTLGLRFCERPQLALTTLLNDWLYDGVLATTPDGCLALRRPRDLWTLAGYATPAEAAAPAPAPR
jgi:hypothetical protein